MRKIIALFLETKKPGMPGFFIDKARITSYAC